MPRLGRSDKPIVIEVPYGKPKEWSIWITGEDGNERNYSRRTFFKLTKKINNLWFTTITMLGIKKSDNIKEENVIKIFSENKIIFKGIIKNIDYANSYTTNLTCYGMASVLKKYETDNTYSNTATQTIYTALVDTATSGDEYPITMSSDDGTYANVTVTFDDENNLKGLNDLTESIDYEWYEDYGNYPYDSQNIHIVNSMGRTASQYSFTKNNSYFNKRKQNTDDQCNYCIVLGYGDGVNQLKSECYHATDNRTTLASALTAAETSTITVTDGTDLPSSGNVWVGCEKITYTGKTGNNLTTLTRGVAYLGNVQTTSNLTDGNGYAHEKGVAVFDAQYTTSSPESGSSIHTYKLKKHTYTDPSIVDQNALDRIANKIIDNNKDPIETVYINSYRPHTILNSVGLGDNITITDAQLDLSSASRRVVGMVCGFGSENGNYIQLQCSNQVPNFIERLTDTEDETKKANKFMQGATNIYAISSYENADNSTNLDMRFYLPADVIAVSSVKLQAKIKDYRAYSATSAGGSEAAKTSSAGSSHTHTITMTAAGTHSHGIGTLDLDWSDYVGTTTAVGSTSTDGSHEHQAETSAGGEATHTHTVNLSTHTHAMSYGIDETAGGSDGTVDIWIGEDGSESSYDTGLSGTISEDITDEIKDLVDGTGKWINIQFRPSKKMRIEANCYIKLFVKSD